MAWRASVAVVVLLAAGCLGPQAGGPRASPAAAAVPIHLARVLDGLQDPLFFTQAPDGAFYAVEQAGRIERWDGHELVTFLDITGEVASGGERGLLGLAFDPRGGDAGFVVDYTDLHGDTVIRRYTGHVGSESEPATLQHQDLLHIAQPYANHNGGMVAFGPDGDLYIGMGDGGSGGDPQNHAQDLGSLLGKILRIRLPDCPQHQTCPAYTIPSDNPFVNRTGARPEVWAYGLRNPWRFSFDTQGGDLWIGDVGQDKWEEVDHQSAASRGGEDYGWSAFEGLHAYDGSRTAPGAIAPVAEYGHGDNVCAVTGGYVDHGSIPALLGVYLYGDYCNGKVWGIQANDATAFDACQHVIVQSPHACTDRALVLDTGMQISSFGQDNAGNVYIVDHAGAVYEIVAGA